MIGRVGITDELDLTSGKILFVGDTVRADIDGPRPPVARVPGAACREAGE